MFNDILLKLSRQLYPTGRAFKMPFESFHESLHVGLALSENRAYSDALSILYNILPDNDVFGVGVEGDVGYGDIEAWERRLGLISNNLVSDSDRKLAIIRKINFPGTQIPRQNWRWLQKQLNDAGFDVYVWENKFEVSPGVFETEDPLTWGGSTTLEHGMPLEHGMAEHGGSYTNLVANHIDEDLDAYFNVGDNLKSTFFIGGTPVGTFANIDVNRKDEFRELILKIKPLQTVAYLFVNYV